MHPGKTLLYGAVLALTVADGTAAASLDVHITNLRPTQIVQVSVFKDAGSWASQYEPVSTTVVAARGTSQTVRIAGLPPGRYAVHARQDRSDTGFAEPLAAGFARSGSSGNPNRYGAVDFERAAVAVGAAGARVSIHLWTSSAF